MIPSQLVETTNGTMVSIVFLFDPPWEYERAAVKIQKDGTTISLGLLVIRPCCSKKVLTSILFTMSSCKYSQYRNRFKRQLLREERIRELCRTILVAQSKHQLPPNDGRHDKAICKWSKSQKPFHHSSVLYI